MRGNPNYLYADKLLHLPSLNEIRAMIVKQPALIPLSRRAEIIAIIFSSLAVKMGGSVIFASAVIWLLSAGYGFADKMVSGAELRAGLTDFLAKQGYDSDPVINPERLFRPCDQPLAYSPLFGSFRQLKFPAPIVQAGESPSAQKQIFCHRQP